MPKLKSLEQMFKEKGGYEIKVEEEEFFFFFFFFFF